MEQEAQFYTQLDALHWPDGYNDSLKEMVHYFEEHPAMYQQLQALSKHLLALADLPEDSPKVEYTLEEITQSSELLDFVSNLSHLSEQASQKIEGEHSFVHMFTDLMMETLSPAQRRFLTEMSRRYTQG